MTLPGLNFDLSSDIDMLHDAAREFAQAETALLAKTGWTAEKDLGLPHDKVNIHGGAAALAIEMI